MNMVTIHENVHRITLRQYHTAKNPLFGNVSVTHHRFPGWICFVPSRDEVLKVEKQMFLMS